MRQALRTTAIAIIATATLALPRGQPAPATYPGRNGLIVYSDNDGQLETIKADGTGASGPLTNFSSWAEAPQASADGKWIVFDANDGTNTDLYKIRPDGTGLMQLT